MVASAIELPLRWKPLRFHPVQSRLFHSTARFCVVEAGRRSGKSELAKRRGVERALTHHERSDSPGRYVFAAPTREQAKRIYWLDVKQLVPSDHVARISESELWIELANMSRISVVGLDAAERIEGSEIDGFFGDEAQEWKPGVWQKSIGPALETVGRPGFAWIYGVPRPGAEFDTLARIAKSGERGWEYFTWKSEEILDRGQLDVWRSTMDSRLFAQEFEAQRVSMTGRVYPDFECATHARDGIAERYDPRLPLELCFDFNRSPGVAVAVQQLRIDKHDVLRDTMPTLSELCDCYVGEVHIPEASDTPMVCRQIVSKWGAHQGQIRCYGDPTGGNKGTAKTEGSDWEIIMDRLGRHFGRSRVQLRVRNRAFGERARVNALNARIKDAADVIHSVFDRRSCARLCEDLEAVVVKAGTDGEIDKDRDKSKTHLSDAISYRAEFEFGLSSHVTTYGEM